MKALDFTLQEVSALAKVAREAGLEQLANDCDEIAAGRSTLKKCFPVQAAIEAWRKTLCKT